MFRPRASYFPGKESSQSSPGLRARTQGSPTRQGDLPSGARSLTLLPWRPGLPGPGWSENGMFLPLSFGALVCKLCNLVPGPAARIVRPRRATVVRRSGNRFCSLSWWGYRVSPVKRIKFPSQTGRMSPIRFCSIRPTQGRRSPVTGSGVGPVEAEGAARGRFWPHPGGVLVTLPPRVK